MKPCKCEFKRIYQTAKLYKCEKCGLIIYREDAGDIPLRNDKEKLK